jgi:hypothetical protein
MESKHLKFLECLCVKSVDGNLSSSVSLSAKISCTPANLRATLVGHGDISKADVIRARSQSLTLTGAGSLSARLSVKDVSIRGSLSGEGDIDKSSLTAKYVMTQEVAPSAKLNPITLEKIKGDFGDFECVQKLYPIKDVDTDLSMGKFVGPNRESGSLYSFIDEGVLIGDHDKPFGQSQILSDDHTSYIQPNTFSTDGEFQYKADLTNVLVRPDETRFRIRASAPLGNYEAKIPPKYTVHNIKLTDPSGGLIVHYNDIIFKGDADQENKPKFNFSTFSSAPKVNNVTENYGWQEDYPFMSLVSGYQISFDVKVEALDDAFAQGFDRGFEEDNILFKSSASGSDYLALDGSPLSTQDQSLINPTRNIHISAIEICNSGLFGEGYGPRYENYLRLYTEVPVKGRRIEKKIIPNFMPLAEFDTGIWPSVSSIWEPNNALNASNQDECGAQQIIKNISDGLDTTYATIDTTGPHLDSGKLTLRFTHGHDLSEITDGAFGFGFDQSIANSWYHPSGAFNTENKTSLPSDENGFFTVESVTLKVRAKKASGSRDFVFDVVGYSDDKLLNVTKAPSGFLQNPSGVQVNNIIFASEGVHPYVSGFHLNTNDLSLGGESLSERDTHFEASGNAGGDHYSLTTHPKVASEDFADYEVPLKIFDDSVKLGTVRDHSMGSLFENLYLDIYPIPSGASIADIHLLVRFAPQDAFNLWTQGGEKIRKITDGRSEGKIFPAARGSSDDTIFNAGSGYNPISTISNIPHAYATPSSVKSNYSRRWRGMEGTVNGPFDVDMFSFGFENPHVDFPFKLGHYDFTERLTATNFKSRNHGLNLIGSGDHIEHTVSLTNGNYQFDILKNIGWRFSSGTIFQDHLAGYTTSYETTDWTSYSDGSHDFIKDDLYGKIADAFDTAVRVSGRGGGTYLDMSPDSDIIDTSGGFSVFLRFTPDKNVSGKIGGTEYNLFNSGVLFSKWESANNLDFALGYKDGYLTAYAKDIDSNVIQIQDTLKYHAYNYPLSVLLTYNDHNQSGLKLYTDNEANQHTYTEAFEGAYDGEHVYIRASSVEPFRKIHTPNLGVSDPDIHVGWSTGSGVGMNMFVTEFGVSTFESGVNSGASVVYPYGSGTNIVERNADRTHKQVTAAEFFAGVRAKFSEPEEGYNTDTYELWDYVNEDTHEDWSLGGFRYKGFTSAFASLGSAVGKRSGRDLIGFDLKHHGSGYIQYANHSMPTNVDSGVAYHTQIENDFLRFHLSDTADNFYSASKRISKKLPAGYKFSENALVVDTIIEHLTDNVISWDKCLPIEGVACTEHRHDYQNLYGPKLIVSLYTKRQEPRWSTDQPNWGLINRDIHYLSPSSCITKTSSTFSYDSLTDVSEQWALFPDEPRHKDFDERYFSQDVDDMFLQYDIVYPSGPPFESRVNIHSAHVRMEDALVSATEKTGNMSIYASGANVLNANLDTFISGGFSTDPILYLYTDGSLVPWSGINLSTIGAYPHDGSLPLYAISSLVRETPSGLNLGVSGELRPSIGTSGSFNLVMPNIHGTASVNMPLYMLNSDASFIPSGGALELFVYAAEGYTASGTTGIRAVPFNMNIAGKGVPLIGPGSESLNLNVFGFAVPENRFPSVSMPLFIDTPQTSTVSMPLYITNIPKIVSSANSEALGSDQGGEVNGLNLFAANYGGAGSDYLMWYNDSFGTAIEQEDNVYATVDIGNEIRGVDLIGFGSCTGNSTKKAIDPPLITDDTVWREETCEDGGIFRAISTYTNLTASGFGDTVGYSGNYYGIRKYTGLTPGAPYETRLNIVTGNTDPINVPRDLEDWEYGHCGPEHFVDAGGTSGCCTSDCDQPLVYSGGKLIGDYPVVNNSFDLTPESGRNPKDNYGRTVSVEGDLMAVGSPNIHIPYIDDVLETEEQIDEAGAVFLYRRGQDVAGRKATWGMEDKLMLPSGHRKDFITNSVTNLVTYDQWSISGKQWNVGQEGRRLGTSLDLCSSGDRETVIAGAPFAKWTREFESIVTSGLSVGMVVFTDSFDYSKSKVEEIATAARKWDILYKYFSAPWYGGTDHEFQPQLDIKLLVFQIARQSQSQPDVKHDHSWFTHKYLPRMDDKDVTNEDGYQATFDGMLSGVKVEFLSAFRHAFGPHSGLPPILGIFREKSNSAGLGAFYNPLDNTNVVDEFIDFYQDHAYASGVIDPEASLPYNRESGYFSKTLAPSEDWVKTSISLLNDTLSSGNLINQDALKYITSGVGQEWSQDNAYEFQIPPSSGGRVYIFEKESGIFNCVQEIKSFADRAAYDFSEETPGYKFGYGSEHNDRYGHSVSISKNSEIISIGSPFTHTPCEIYQRDDTEDTRMYSRVRDYLDSISDTSGVQRYDILLADSGSDIARRVSYHEMTHDNKFGIRSKYDIELYRSIFNYGYGDIKSVGTWRFILGEFLGTSRLGYSTATSDDGDIVAFGAPTDSTTIFEDTNVWYKGKDTWASYTNAGAVRIFESRKIYPHSGVVEYTRFGNLDRDMHQTERDQGFYDQMGLYFQPSNLPFRRTGFEELEIPQDVGLAFIITPELDADSDEIIDNIKNWLALGDRTLVIVGNDPVYEENGLYKESNDVVNRILKKLGSRMKIVPADDEFQSLPNCISSEEVFSDKYNVTRAFQPTYNHTKASGSASNISKGNIFAKGVGDIRMNLADLELEDFIERSPCDKINTEVCNLPLKHLGDLRAEWSEQCVKTIGRKKILIGYQKNWPFHFSNPNPSQSCDYPPRPHIDRPYQDVVPVLTAAEWTQDSVTIIPARSGVNCQKDYCWKYIKRSAFKEYKAFAKHNEDAVYFSVAEDADSNVSGIFNEYDLDTFLDPEKKNTRDSIIQGSGSPYSGRPITESRTLLSDSILALQESYYIKKDDQDPVKTTSNVVMMASLLGENERSFGVTGSDSEGDRSNNNDQNVLFYVNIVLDDCTTKGKVLQLGGWTGRQSFKEAYSSSTVDQATNVIKERLESFGIEVEENFVIEDKTTPFPDTDITTGTEITTLWIASPTAKPDDQEIDRIKDFLERGNKKVVITYFGNNNSTAQSNAEIVDYICSSLNLSSRPMFVPSIGEYFIQRTKTVSEGNEQEYPKAEESVPRQIVNSNTLATTGCEDGYGWYGPHGSEPIDTKIDKVALWPYGYHNGDNEKPGSPSPEDYIPISGGGDFSRIISYDDVIQDSIVTVPELYKIDASSTIEFPTHPGSGYRIFFNYVSETDNDYYDIDVDLSEAQFDPNGDEDSVSEKGYLKIPNTIARDLTTLTADFIAKSDSITLKLASKHTYIKPDEEQASGRGLPPLTTRILSISGCPLEIETKVLREDYTEKVPCDPPFTETCSGWFEPEKQFVIPGEFRPIKHPSEPYCQTGCGYGEKEIEDGPVVVAEEFEHFSAGSKGNKRSKIVVVSDSTILQGQCPQYRSDALYENQMFIRSLYPESAVRQDLGRNDILGGRNFQFTQKLRAPERGSAAKYYGVSGISNTVSPLYGMAGVSNNLEYYVDNEDTYDPANVDRPADPATPDGIGQEIKNFGQVIAPKYGLFPRFSGDFLNEGSYSPHGYDQDYLVDADGGGGIPDLMKINGTDYLDFDIYDSGCPGDLFGFSIDLTQDKLIVGTPFNAFRSQYAASGVSGIVQWHEIENDPTLSGIELCENGGAGAAFYFERTGNGSNAVSELLPWEFKQKIKPESVNVGLTSPTITSLSDLGDHNLDSDFIQDHARKPDQFGHSVALDADMMVVGAPNHNFESLHDHSIYNSGEFIRKEFNRAFVIPHHVVHDLGSSGVRGDTFANNSGTLVLNNGAVYSYRHAITDWTKRSKEWMFREKLYSQGFKDRTAANKFVATQASGCENDNFGWSVGLNRSKRHDSDYTLVVGAPFHEFATSGNHPLSSGDGTGVTAAISGNGLTDAGSAYTFDGMLRGHIPSIPTSDGWIDVEVFGDKGATDRIQTKVYQPALGEAQRFTVSGLVFANQNGDIFLEGSGFDSSPKGFIAHRPYVESVVGTLLKGTGVSNSLNMSIFGKPNFLDNAWPPLVGEEEFDTSFAYDMDSLINRPSGLSLFITGPDSANVYNSMDLSIEGVSGLSSGTLFLIASASVIDTSGTLNLNIGSEFPSNTLNLNTRGR